MKLSLTVPISCFRLTVVLLALILCPFTFTANAAPVSPVSLLQSPWNQEAQGSGQRAGYSAPAVAELDGDTSNGMEIVAASLDGTISAFHADGSVMWETTTPDSECGGPSKVNSTPAIGNIFGDGIPYVVVGYGPIAKNCQGGVMAINGRTGAMAWKFSTKDFSKKEKFWAVLHTVFSSPALADTDGDGKMEIGFGSFDRNVYLLNANGTVRWYYNAADTVWSSPVFAKIDNSNELKMIIGTDITGNSQISPPTFNGGNLYAFNTKANPNKLYRFRDKAAFVWMKPVEQVLFSTPTVGEIIAGNAGPEIAINSGCYFPEKSNNKVGKWTKIFSAKTGKILRTIPLEACSTSKPALYDINGDGEAEIFTTVNGSTSIGGDGSSHLEAFDGATGNKLWSIVPRYKDRNYAWGGNFISPVVADLFGDGKPKVIVPVAAGVGIYDAATGAAVSCESSSASACSAAQQPKLGTADILLNSVVVNDIDADGRLDIIAAGKSTSGGLGVYRW